MTGLLRSLGAQALDQAPALRPAARVRDAAAIYLDRERAGEPTTPSGTIPRVPVARSADRAASTAAPQTHRVARAAQRREAAERDEQTADAHVRRHDGARTTVAGHDTVDHAKDVRRAGIRETARERVNRDAEPEHRAPATTTATAIAANPPRRPERRPRVDESFTVRARTTREPSIPDVQIRIGRIELTAVTSPATASTRATPPGKKPMSLDEYLRERKRKTT